MVIFCHESQMLTLFQVTCSFVQVYQDKVYDMLSQDCKDELCLREHPKKGENPFECLISFFYLMMLILVYFPSLHFARTGRPDSLQESSFSYVLWSADVTWSIFMAVILKVPLRHFFSSRNLIELNALILKPKSFLRSELWLLTYDLSKSWNSSFFIKIVVIYRRWPRVERDVIVGTKIFSPYWSLMIK